MAKRRLLTAIATLAALAALPAQAIAGPTSFVRHIHWTPSSPARGVQLLDGTFTDANVQPSWTVTIQAPTQSPFDDSAEVAEAGRRGWARQTVAALTADGLTAHQTTLSWPRYADDPRGFMGVRVRVGEFRAQAAATAQVATLSADGFKPLVEWEGFDPQNKPDAELLHAAIVDPQQLRRPNGAPFATDRQTSIVSAAPVLLRNGRVSIDASTEGVFDPRDLNNYSFSADRHARTIAGVDSAGRLILVTADAVPTRSEGLTLTEEAKLMRSLGATDGLNLDGGGSTGFVVDGTTINMTSDATGPRTIGDSIQVVG